MKTTNAEIDAAIARGKRVDQLEPRANRSWYDADSDSIVVALSNGVEMKIPRNLLQGLNHGTQPQIADIEIVGGGTGLRWPALDVDHYVRGLLAGVFGTKRWMEQRRLAGSVTSPAKAAAARRNGRRGGRPKNAAV